MTCFVLSRLCEWYILVDIVRTGIFGDDRKLNKKNTHYYGKDAFIVSNIFDNDLTSFEKLLEYCVKDIKYNNSVGKVKDIYKLNDIYHRGHYGISFYVLNRLTYVMIYYALIRKMIKIYYFLL